MANSYITLDYSQLDELQNYIEKFEGESLKIINEVIHGKAPKIIQRNIQKLLPESGRKWKGKKAGARNAVPFMADNSEMLATTIKTKKNYGYLYFPDDGSNTEKHRGNQNFTGRGAEASKEEIINLCIGSLADEFNF